MLNDMEKEQILSKFPNVKLSYENIIHNKVNNYDFVVAIPEGKKCFVWFTTYKNSNVCYIMELGENKQISNIKIIHCCFNKELSNGTIFYGTILNINKTTFFSIEDVLFYKGKNISIHTWIAKLELLKNFLTNEITQTSSIIFGLPLMSNKLDELSIEITKLQYKIKHIQFKSFGIYNILQYIDFKNIHVILKSIKYETPNIIKNYVKNDVKNDKNKYGKKNDIVFKIKPDIQNDIYYLYCYNDNDTNNKNSNSLMNYDVAYIADFKTSVMMNKLFRNIKENDNLDILEESDNEEDFENNKEDRFVYLDREINMICSYNNKFKKWMPKRLANENMKIVNHSELIYL